MLTISRSQYKILSKIDSPYDLKKVPKNLLSDLATEIRDFLIRSLNVSGGHLASNLGVVELTIALHFFYNTPSDYLIWDVGHQCYVHKILTGRADCLTKIKHQNGPSGFPNRLESNYDNFGTGHSSTSISAALGMDQATRIQGLKRKTVAVIGDGALTAGIAFEAINHLGSLSPTNVLVILNDNKMSISDNVGALSMHCKSLSVSTRFNLGKGNFCFSLFNILKKLGFRRLIKQLFETKNTNFFESLNFSYFGPIDGHDLKGLLKALQKVQNLSCPVLLHVITKKGKGYSSAESDPVYFHHVNKGFVNTKVKNTTSLVDRRQSYSDVFGNWLCDMAAKSSRLVAVTPAMKEGSNLVRFSREYSNRYYDVGIAEQHAVTFAAGLAASGCKPVVAIYSTFLQRAYDQVIHDISLQNLDVLYAVDRSGIIASDAPTHSGVFDLSFIRCIPNIIIAVPSDENECYHMLTLGYNHNGAVMVRYPKGLGTGVPISLHSSFVLGEANIVKRGKKIAILSFGPMLKVALDVAGLLDITVVDMRFVKPLDTNVVNQIASTHQLLITLEENVVMGGAGSAVNEYLMAHDLMKTGLRVRNLGIPDYHQVHGNKDSLMSHAGISSEKIIKLIKNTDLL